MVEIFDGATGLFEHIQEHFGDEEWITVKEGRFIINWRQPYGSKGMK